MSGTVAAGAGGRRGAAGTARKTGEERRREIVDATLSILVEEGEGAWTTAEIARRVGVSEAALFKHFDSKDEILAEAITRQARGLRRRVTGYEPQAAGWNRVEGLVRDVLAYLEETEGGPLLLLLGRAGRILPSAEQEVREARRCLRERLAEAVARSEAAAGRDPGTVADLLTAVIQASALRWLLDGRSRDLRSVAGPMLGLVADALAGTPAEEASPDGDG